MWFIADADAEFEIACYATLSMSSVDRSLCPPALASGTPTQVPGLLVGRLATDQRKSGNGLSTEMVKHILATAVELNLRAACRAVVVTALTPAAFTWWQRCGFVPVNADEPVNLDLYLLTKDIHATVLGLG